MIFLAHGTIHAKKRLYHRIHRRLDDLPEFAAVHYEPSDIRPRRIHAAVDPTIFVDESYPNTAAQLLLEFELRGGTRNRYWITWVESDAGFSCGWHQDATHEDLGPCHWQLDYRDETVREPDRFLDDHPYAVFEKRMAELPDKLRALWSSSRASAMGRASEAADGE